MLILAFTSCKGKSNSGEKPQTQTKSGTTAVEKMPPVQIKLITSYDTFETANIIGEYFDTNRNEGKSLVIWTDITVRDLDFISLDFDYEKDGLFAESILHSIIELPPGKIFLVNFPWIGGRNPYSWNNVFRPKQHKKVFLYKRERLGRFAFVE
jgi:hypothetical protein